MSSSIMSYEELQTKAAECRDDDAKLKAVMKEILEDSLRSNPPKGCEVELGETEFTVRLVDKTSAKGAAAETSDDNKVKHYSYSPEDISSAFAFMRCAHEFIYMPTPDNPAFRLLSGPAKP